MPPLPVLRLLPPAPAPTLMVIVDTEEEFDWEAPFDRASTTVENIAHQHLAQAIFDAHGIAPTYAVDYPVASTPEAVAVLRPILDRDGCDIGAHLHPWVNPPHEEAVTTFNSYACNLPAGLMQRKLRVLTETIRASFGRAPVVYKAGRYGAGPGTPAALETLGYLADASVVPHTDFGADGGPDFRAMPDQPFLAANGLLEVPLSVHFVGRVAGSGPRLFPLLERARHWRLPGLASRLGLLERLRLSPEGHEFDDMVRQTQAALAQGQRYLALTYHSSSLMPGGSPYARTLRERDQLVRTLAQYLSYFLQLPGARTMTVRALAESLAEPALDGHHSYAASL